MCGIYGELSVALNEAAKEDARRTFAQSAARSLRHRGPDGEGVFFDDHCLLGHTRLAILDTGDTAAQPMRSASGRSHLVFNGEIYNYVELRSSLRMDLTLRSTGDTEVLLEALEQDGMAALDACIGMFALALWRPASRELLLVRDRVGKKPLYVARTRNSLRFASEMGAILDDGVVPRETSLDRLAEFLQHGYVAGPRTGFCGVEVVPPGGFLRATIDASGKQILVEHGRWWRLPEPDRVVGDEASWREEFDALLNDAVRIRLRSDVPLGAFLSGGVDSSVVSLLASRKLAAPLRTFTVDFDERAWSEGPYAAEVARHLGAQHTELRLTPDVITTLPALCATYGDLHGDSSALPTLALCRATREHVKVALSGDGGDELLGGYTRYASTLRMAERAGRMPKELVRASKLLGQSVLPWWMRGASFFGRMSARLDEVYERELWAWGPHRWPNVLRKPETRETELAAMGDASWPDAVARALEENRGRPSLLRLMACDLATYLPEDILVKVDRASMAHGLEVRAPLLDHRLIEHAMRAEPSWVFRKAPLKRLYASALPPSVFTRKKAGFAVPLSRWLGTDLLPLAKASLFDPGSRVAAVLDGNVLRRVLNNPVRDEASHVWSLLVLHAWFEKWKPVVVAYS